MGCQDSESLVISCGDINTSMLGKLDDGWHVTQIKTNYHDVEECFRSHLANAGYWSHSKKSSTGSQNSCGQLLKQKAVGRHNNTRGEFECFHSHNMSYFLFMKHGLSMQIPPNRWFFKSQIFWNLPYSSFSIWVPGSDLRTISAYFMGFSHVYNCRVWDINCRVWV